MSTNLSNNQIRDLNKMNRAMQNCSFGTLLSLLEEAIKTEGITASASALTDLTNTTTITLGEIIPSLARADFVVKKNGTAMVYTTDYTIADINTLTPDVVFGLNKVVNGDVITVTITKDEFLINGGNPIAVTNLKSILVTASSNGIASKTGMTTLTLGSAVATLAATDIGVSVDGLLLTLNTDYTIADVTTSTIDVTFLAPALLTSEKTVTITIVKMGYIFNGSNDIAVANTIPVDITASASVIATPTGISTITLNEAVATLVNGDITVKVDGSAIALTTDYTIADVATSTIDITFLAGAGLTSDSVVTVVIVKTGYVFNSGTPIAVTNAIPVEITVSASALTTKTGMSTVTLNEAVATLADSDFTIIASGHTLTLTDDYTIADVTTTTIDITFTAGASLDSTSAIAFVIVKAGYIFNSGSPIVITNSIPVDITASSNAISSATGTITITLNEAVATLVNGDITVNVDATPIHLTDDYTIADVATDTIDITFLAGAGLSSASVITVVIAKTGYVFNADAPIAVTNSIL